MPWAPAYVSAAELADWLRDTEDAAMGQVCETASRALDDACDRRFGVTETEARRYSGDYWRGSTIVDHLDDTFDAALTIDTDAAFTLLPRNAPQKGRPWTRIEIQGCVSEVEVTAKWGWTDVPEAIKQATLIQAGRFWERRNSPGGVLTTEQVDDVRRGWAAGTAADLDADVLTAIAPYRRITWVAV